LPKLKFFAKEHQI